MESEKVLQYIRKNPSDLDGARERILALADHADAVQLRNFFVRCRNAGLKGDQLTYNAVYWLASADRDDVVDALFESATEQHAFYGFYHLGKAFSRFKKFDVAHGASHLRSGLFHCLMKENLDFEDFGYLQQNNFLLQPVAFPLTERLPDPTFEVVCDKKYATTPYTVFFIADPLYVRYYAERFIDTLRAQCGPVNIFATVANADDESVERLKTYDGITIATTAYDGRWLPEFTTVARFALAEEVLEYVRGPVIFMDIDSTFPEGSAEVLEKIASVPLAYTKKKDDFFPSLSVWAATLGARPSEEASRFFGVAKDHMLKDLARKGPLWGLDQTGLYRTVCQGMDEGWNIVDINAIVPGGVALPEFFASGGSLIPLDERKAKRSNSQYVFRGITGEGRMIVADIDDLPPQEEEQEEQEK